MTGIAAETMQVQGGRSAVELSGPSSQILRFSTGMTLPFSWAPVDRRQCEVELRARMVGVSSDALGAVPVVRWRMQLGHGRSVWPEPPPVPAFIAGSPMHEYTLPARGMILRLNVRELKLLLRLAPPIGGPDIASVDVELSVQPCWGMLVPQVPYAHWALAGAGFQQPHPMEAREWRLTDLAGLPLAPGAVGIVQLGIAGALFGAADGASYADYRPVPHDAAGWTCDADCYAYYR